MINGRIIRATTDGGTLPRLTPRQDLRTVAKGLFIVLGLLLFAAAMRLGALVASAWMLLQGVFGRPRPIL